MALVKEENDGNDTGEAGGSRTGGEQPEIPAVSSMPSTGVRHKLLSKFYEPSRGQALDTANDDVAIKQTLMSPQEQAHRSCARPVFEKDTDHDSTLPPYVSYFSVAVVKLEEGIFPPSAAGSRKRASFLL